MSKTTVVASVCFASMATAIVLGTVVYGVDESSTPFVTTVLGFIGVAVAQLVGNARAEKTEATVTELNKDLRNGTFRRLVREALEEIAADHTTQLEIKKERREEDGGQGL